MAKKRPTRKRYLKARKIMREAPGVFYYDVVGNKEGNPKRYMRVKYLDPAAAYELYALMLGFFNDEDVRIYASADLFSGTTYHKGAQPDTVRVTLTSYWPNIKEE